jgi:hypothetical protein
MKTTMITSGAKFFFGLAALALFGAAVFAWGNHGGLSGVITFGIYGGVGDHAGYIVLLSAAAAAAFLGGLALAFRDADADAVQSLISLESLPEVREPRINSYWPVLGAVAAACCAVGLVVSAQLFVFGILVGIVVLLEWMVSAWADRATGDPAANRRVRNRLMNPVEFPVFGAIGIVALIFLVSRVLLAVNEHASAAIALGFAALLLAVATIIALSPRSVRTVLAVVCIVVALGVIAGGIISAAQGSRNYEKEHPENPFAPADRNQPTPTSLPE